MSADGSRARADEKTQRIVLLIATVSSFLSPFMLSAANVALPSIAKELRMDAVLLTWVPMAYLLSGAIFLLPIGRIADIHGRKKVFGCGLALFAVSSVLSGLAGSGAMLILLRVFQGIGGAMIFGTCLAILMSVYPANKRGRALGITVAAVYVGLSAGPFIGGFLTEQLGWRSIFFLSGGLGLATLGLLLWKLKGEWAEAEGEGFDFAGSVIYCISLTAVTYGLHLLPRWTGFLSLSLGIAGLVWFLRWETRIEHPIFDWKLFRHNRIFALSNFAAFANYSATSAIGFLISLYLQYVKGLSPQQAGLIMVSQPAMQALFSPYAGRLSDRAEPQMVASIGMALTVTGLGLFTLIGEGTSLWFVAGTLILLGFGFALFSSPNTNAVMGSVDKRYYGVASGILSTMRLMGSSFSIGAVMFIFSIYIGPVQITPQYHPVFLTSIRVVFVIFAFICLGGILASLSRGKTH